MNTGLPPEQETHRTFLLMNEIEKGEALSQRELAGRLGIALGLVNSYLKNLTSKGFVRIKNFPRNRYSYLLTPKGIAEKSRLAYQHMSYFNNLYTVVRQDYLALFAGLLEQGHCCVVFCGVDEVTEIAYLSLRETGLSLAAVVDAQTNRSDFEGHIVADLKDWPPINDAPVVLTSLKRSGELRLKLLENGIVEERVFSPTGVG